MTTIKLILCGSVMAVSMLMSLQIGLHRHRRKGDARWEVIVIIALRGLPLIKMRAIELHSLRRVPPALHHTACVRRSFCMRLRCNARVLPDPKQKCRDVRDLVAIRWKADTKRISPEDRL